MANPLQRSLREAQTVVFVCTGNMVRSAFADLYARHIGLQREIRSAATTYRNPGIMLETARALERRGVERSRIQGFRPVHFDDFLPQLRSRAIFFGMTRAHLAAIRGRGVEGSVFLLGEVTGDLEEIRDPVLEGADFDETFGRVARCVEELAVLEASLGTPG